MSAVAKATLSNKEHRGSIFVEDAEVIDVQRYPGEQFVIRLHSPKCAQAATAGSFVHLRCDAAIPMRRPLSIMRANPADGWIEVMFKIVGDGLRALAMCEIGDSLSSMGPIGRGFEMISGRSRALLIGGGVGIPPMIFLAKTIRDNQDLQPLVIMGSEVPFPFALRESAIDLPWLDPSLNSTIGLVEDWGIPARLASLSNFDGTARGYVTDLARTYLESLDGPDLRQVAIYSCGPTPMLKAVADLAREFDLPCQVSLEEFMACAVGGCAGCTVLVQTDDGPAMKKVCVEGPVFDAQQVFAD